MDFKSKIRRLFCGSGKERGGPGRETRSVPPASCAVVIGHTEKKQGARAYDGQSEWAWNHLVGSLLTYEATRYIALEMQVFIRESALVNTADFIRSKWPNGPDMTVELHFNSFEEEVEGTEVLVLKEGLALQQNYVSTEACAKVIAESISTAYASSLRHTDGIKVVGQTEKGAWNMFCMHDRAMSPVSVLVEPQFCNFPTTHAKDLIEDPKRYARVLAEAIFEKCLGRVIFNSYH